MRVGLEKALRLLNEGAGFRFGDDPPRLHDLADQAVPAAVPASEVGSLPHGERESPAELATESARRVGEMNLRGGPTPGRRREADEIDVAVRPSIAPGFTPEEDDGAYRDTRRHADSLPQGRMSTCLRSEKRGRRPLQTIQWVSFSR